MFKSPRPHIRFQFKYYHLWQFIIYPALVLVTSVSNATTSMTLWSSPVIFYMAWKYLGACFCTDAMFAELTVGTITPYYRVRFLA